MNIAIGADHRGFECKAYLKQYIVGGDDPIAWIDVGVDSSEYCDYPIFGRAVCEAVRSGQADRGILICGSGIGMSVVANRFDKIYAGIAWNEAVAKQSREDDNTNVLVLPSDFVSLDDAVKIVNVWLLAQFKGGRYQERIAMVDSITRGLCR